jgi:hypothetical protein
MDALKTFTKTGLHARDRPPCTEKREPLQRLDAFRAWAFI